MWKKPQDEWLHDAFKAKRELLYSYDPYKSVSSCHAHRWCMGPTFGLTGIYFLVTHRNRDVQFQALQSLGYVTIYLVFTTIAMLFYPAHLYDILRNFTFAYILFTTSLFFFYESTMDCPEHRMLVDFTILQMLHK